MTPAIDKLERRLAALDQRIHDALSDPANLPVDWEMLVTRSGDLVDRIAGMKAEQWAKSRRRAA